MKHQIKYLQNLFYDLLNDYGRAFVVVKFSDRTIIGNRGFTDEEKEKGLILVFNSRNHKNLQWTEDGSIVAALGFGMNNRIENCFIHQKDIISVFSPEARVKFDRWDVLEAKEPLDLSEPSGETETKTERPVKERIISLDNFRKTKT
jgi:hypothetical protein